MWRWVLSTAALLLVASGGVQAQPSPIGLWATIDDQTDQEKSIVRIAPQGKEIVGVVEKILDPKGQNAKCIKCPEPMKDQPILGMTILRRLATQADDPSVWTGGEILDPENGKFYKVQIKVINNGKNLEVRGYIGMPMFGRTQTWVRLE
jgi:uncharacterized protein (DUF2147 family)